MKVYQVVDNWEYENEGHGGYKTLKTFASVKLAAEYIRRIDSTKLFHDVYEELTVKDEITGEGLSTVRSIEYISQLYRVIFNYTINELEVIESLD